MRDVQRRDIRSAAAHDGLLRWTSSRALLLLEDAGELMSASARADVGQGLSRALSG